MMTITQVNNIRYYIMYECMYRLFLKIDVGSESDPWRTLSYAVQRIRTIRNHNNPPGPENTATIYISGDIHYLPETLQLNGRDDYLTIKNYRGQKVILSGGFPLDIDWKQQGDTLTGSYSGDCGEMYYGDFRLEYEP